MRDKKKVIGSIVIFTIFSLFLVLGYFLSRPYKEVDTKEVFNETTVVESKASNITVYINGEVKNPGVYKLKNDSRVEDLVKIAGGFNSESDKDKLNLAKKLKDEDYVYVDRKNQIKDSQTASQSTINKGTGQNSKVDINTATKEELKTIPGIGDVTAQKILDYREKNGRFSSIEDLKNIDRIGDKTVENMKDKIDVR
ncbi:helix-hairpin-helix domain-containing protein [Clostridium sp. A1-XYC3]|uniref:Helix-hairpin-helix domain-containing protein n=1 Tax=Clostridium tanneri TaxID=3037988 RepID=A0ABU4JNW7_9CLOT|nr:helix-hairpin-helix domain-containing protein [Clostridium sp. A1-XYC3]MDW8799843.1 helix-hairpin-helix domain-containing protein [Clostridium sp. A1-XYC3]